MRKFLLITIPLVILSGCSFLQNGFKHNSDQSAIDVVFYNTENLFDTIPNPEKQDDEFTPAGKKNYDTERYQTKVQKIGQVLGASTDGYPAIIGLCEVENRAVLEDLNQSKYLKNCDYTIIHEESPDSRGIDCALLYDPLRITIDDYRFIRFTLPKAERPHTRDILYARIVNPTDTLHVFVNHWPSRYGGAEASSHKREYAAKTLKLAMDSIQQYHDEPNILLMGDFNDYPINESIIAILDAGPMQGESSMVNMMWRSHESGEGTYNYKGEWGALDQFIVSRNMIDQKRGFAVSYESASIYKQEWMLYRDKDGNASPSRTYGGSNYYGGFSDHLPIVLKMSLKN